MIKRILSKLGLQSHRSRMQQIAQACNLNLDYHLNRKGLFILEEIFQKRAYADYFPFYTDATVVDIGAHYGYFSLFALKNLGPRAQVIAVEPSSQNHRILAQNMAANQREHFGRFTALNMAISGKVGEVELLLSRGENHSIVEKMYKASTASVDTEKVPSITLEVLFQQQALQKIDFLKLDCEGAEYTILYNTDKSVLKNIKTFSLEFHDTKQKEHTGLALAKYLKTYGFDLVKFQHGPTNMDRNYGWMVLTQENYISP